MRSRGILGAEARDLLGRALLVLSVLLAGSLYSGPALARSSAADTSDNAALSAPGRIVAIGDVHGSHDGLRQILRSTGLVDEQARWIGGGATLVQTGDLTDRGADVKEVFDLLMRLQVEAEAAGGRVVTLLGNHEFYNLVGVFSPESTEPEVFAELVGRFAGPRSEKRQREGLRKYLSWEKRYPGCSASDKEEWLVSHPPGFFEYVEALSSGGRYGRWLRGFPVAVRIDGTIFVHGGLSPELEEMGFTTLDDLNRRVVDEIELYDRGRAWLEQNRVSVPGLTVTETLCAIDSEIFRRVEDGETAGVGDPGADGQEDEVLEVLRWVRGSLPSGRWLALHPNGPLWFRGFAFWSDEDGETKLPEIAARFGAERFVVGHTPQRGKIKARWAGRVFLIDTALVFGKAAGGGPAALEIDGDVVSALYPDKAVVLWDPEIAADDATSVGDPDPASLGRESPRLEWMGPDGQILPLASSEEIEGFLRTASVMSEEQIPLGITKPKRLVLQRDGVRAHAAFRYFREEVPRKKLGGGQVVLLFRDSFENEIVAYRLSRLLGLDRVPPTVARTVDEVPGSLQMWVENATMEVERREAGTRAPDRLRFQRQLYDMHVFDNLIGNFDRNQGNILIDENWDVWLIDHTRSFRGLGDLPRGDKVVRCSRALWRGLQELEQETVATAVGDLLSEREIKSLLQRRDRVVEIISSRIEEFGESKVLFDWGDPNPDVQVLEDVPIPVGNEEASAEAPG